MRQSSSPSPKRQSNSNQSPNFKRTKDTSTSIKEDEFSCSSNANSSIYFRIIHSETEFSQFLNKSLENTFQPTYTDQLFPNQIISGYKNLKILISLTPKNFYPHISITYDKVLTFKDNIEDIFSKHFEQTYTTDNTVFINHLKTELSSKAQPTGQLIHKSTVKSVDREVYNIDILKEKYEEVNWNYQCLLTFFIDGASFIPIEDNFWMYYVIIERCNENEGGWRTVGFCSYKNFHMALDKYCSMISQFIIMPPYQRLGYGNCLLENMYSHLRKIGDECIEISTEDPAVDFILMRDFTIIKMLLAEGSFDKYLKVLQLKTNEIDSNEIYDQFNLSKDDLVRITKEFKLQRNLIQRAFDIVKFVLVNNQLKTRIINEKKERIGVSLKDEYNSESLFKDKKYGPFIAFHDEPEFNVEEVIEEEKIAFNHELTLKEKVEMLYRMYEEQINKIISKVLNKVIEYKEKMHS